MHPCLQRLALSLKLIVESSIELWVVYMKARGQKSFNWMQGICASSPHWMSSVAEALCMLCFVLLQALLRDGVRLLLPSPHYIHHCPSCIVHTNCLLQHQQIPAQS